MAGLLHPAQRHDLHQAADMQAGGGGVEADVGADRALQSSSIQAFAIGRLVDMAALHQDADEIGFWLEVIGHEEAP